MEVRGRSGIVKRDRQGDRAVDMDSSAGRSHSRVASELLESLSAFLVASAVIVDAGVMESVIAGTALRLRIRGSLEGSD
jgi:hypothetical protein